MVFGASLADGFNFRFPHLECCNLPPLDIISLIQELPFYIVEGTRLLREDNGILRANND